MFVCSTQAYDIKSFHKIWPWDYKSEGLYEVDIGINDAKDATGAQIYEGSIVIAVGDLDDNKHSDIITISDDQVTLTIHYFDEKEMNFARYTTIDMGNCKVGSASVIPAPPYRLAVLCTENANYEYLKIMSDVNNANDVNSVDLTAHKMEKGTQPVFIDINSDSYIDFVYNTNSARSDDIIRVAIYNTNTKSYESNTLGFFDNYVYENSDVGCQSVTDKYSLKLSKPNYSTLIDVNSDCVSDLYLMVTTDHSNSYGLMLIATRVRSGDEESLKYCLVENEDLAAAKYTSPVFADLNNDATIDKAFFNYEEKSIHMVYNVREANSASSDHLCKGIPSIADNLPSGYFDNYQIFSTEPDIVTLKDVNGLYSHESITSFIPGQMRIGDLDSDGYPDILATFNTTDGTATTVVLVNSPCDSSSSTNVVGRVLSSKCTVRTLETTNDYSKLAEYNNSLYAFMIDFDDNGRMDFVVVTKDENDTSRVLAFYNNYSRDSYYITASTFTSGENTFGSKVYGVSYRGIYTTLSDNKHPFVAHQLTRSAFASLESPIATYVIGRSNNYIEDFTLAYPFQLYSPSGSKVSLSVESTSWSPIIPNSHLLIGINSLVSSGWNIQLLINPTDSFLLVGIVLSLILIIIGGIIIYIHMQEKKEDEESRNPQLDFF